MRGRFASAVAIAALAGSAGLPGAAPAQPVPNINWVTLLPALQSPLTPQPGPVPRCKKPSIKCVKTVIRDLRELRNSFGCDHRAVFATTYLTLTKEFLSLMREQPDLVSDRRYLFWQDALFADIYFRTQRNWLRGRDVPEAWRIANRTALTGQVTGAQDMLLGINAHVQNDMPFLIAALGLRTPEGESRKPDHDAVNETLNRAYEAVVAEVTKRYDPLVAVTNTPLLPADDIAGLELVRLWREQVWRNAERLVNAESAVQRARVAQSIEDYAGDWATGIAAIKSPGYGAVRDQYCEDQLTP